MANDLSRDEVRVFLLERERALEEGSYEKCLEITIALGGLNGWTKREYRDISREELDRLDKQSVYSLFGINDLGAKPGYPLGPSYHSQIHGALGGTPKDSRLLIREPSEGDVCYDCAYLHDRDGCMPCPR